MATSQHWKEKMLGKHNLSGPSYLRIVVCKCVSCYFLDNNLMEVTKAFYRCGKNPLSPNFVYITDFFLKDFQFDPQQKHEIKI